MKQFIILLLFSLGQIANAQNVGINNTDPMAALDLKGDLRLRSEALTTIVAGLNNDVNLNTTKSSIYKFDPMLVGIQISGFDGGGVDGRIITIFNNTTGAVQLYNDYSTSLAANRIFTGTGNTAVIYQNGSVTLRYDAAIQRWTILNSNYTDGLNGSPNSWAVSSNNIYNTNTENVGVGTSNPAEKLDVDGSIKTTGEIKPNGIAGTANQVLTSNGNGTMQWAAPQSGGNVGFGSWGDCSNNNISEYNPVVDTTGAAFDYFGKSVSISGNYAIVGAPIDDVGANTNQGSASIYQLSGGAWVLMNKITDATGEAEDRFGHSVSISGNYAIVGAPYDAVGANIIQGSVSIYQLSGGSWVLMSKITDATGAPFDIFGLSVSISGNYAIVGAYADDVGANVNQGSASIHQLSGGAWVLMNKITDANGAANDEFGLSVSISGNYAIVGAPYDDVGANTNQGSASIYQLSGGAWEWMNKITDANGAAGDLFGFSVSIFGNYAIVGAPTDDVGANATQGSASIYQKIGLGWQKLQYVTDPGGNSGDGFGGSVSIDFDNKRFIIGAYGYAGSSGKVVFGKIN